MQFEMRKSMKWKFLEIGKKYSSYSAEFAQNVLLFYILGDFLWPKKS